MAANQDIYNYVVNQVMGVDTVTPGLRRLRGEYGKTDKVLETFNKQQKHVGRMAKTSMSAYFATALKGIALWGAATATIYGTIRAIREHIGINRELEYSIAQIKVVTNESANAYVALKEEFFELATTYGGKVTEIAKATKIWTQQGKSLTESLALMRTTLIGVNITGLSTGEITEDLTAAMKAFKISSDNSITILDKWVKVASVAAVTMQTLANATKRSAEAAGIAGITIDELNGIIVALVEATRMSGEQAGTSMKTIVTRLFRDQSREVLKTMMSIDVYTKATIRNYRKLGSILDEVYLKWQDMNRGEKVNFVIKAVGIRKGNEFATMLNHYDRALEATVHSLISQGMAMRANTIIMDTQKKQLGRLTATIAEMWDIFLEGSGIVSILYDFALGIRRLLQDVVAVSRQIQKWRRTLIGTGNSVQLFTYQITMLSGAFLVLLSGGANIPLLLTGIGLTTLGYTGAIGRMESATRHAADATKELAETQAKTMYSDVARLNAVKGLVTKYNSMAEAMENSGKRNEKYIITMDEIKKGIKEITEASPEVFKGLDLTPLNAGYTAVSKLQKKIIEMINTAKKAAIEFEITGLEAELEPLKEKQEAYKEILKQIKLEKAAVVDAKIGIEKYAKTNIKLAGEYTKKKIDGLWAIAKLEKEGADTLTKREEKRITELALLLRKKELELSLNGLENEGLGVLKLKEEKLKKIKKEVDEWLNLEKELNSVAVKGLESIIDRTATWRDLLSDIGHIIRREVLEGLVEAANISGRIRSVIEKTGIFGAGGAYKQTGVPKYQPRVPSYVPYGGQAMIPTGAGQPTGAGGIMSTISSLLPYIGIGMALGEGLGLFGKKDTAPIIIRDADITVDEVTMYAKKVVPIGWYTGTTMTPRSIVHTDISLKVEGTNKLIKVTADRANRDVSIREERY